MTYDLHKSKPSILYYALYGLNCTQCIRSMYGKILKCTEEYGKQVCNVNVNICDKVIKVKKFNIFLTHHQWNLGDLLNSVQCSFPADSNCS